MQEGVEFGEAMLTALYSETPSITIMEIAAIGTDLLIASQAHISDLLFWGPLAFSLSVGFVFADPINATLVYFGVKEGMKNPAEMGAEPEHGTGTGRRLTRCPILHRIPHCRPIVPLGLNCCPCG